MAGTFALLAESSWQWPSPRSWSPSRSAAGAGVATDRSGDQQLQSQHSDLQGMGAQCYHDLADAEVDLDVPQTGAPCQHRHHRDVGLVSSSRALVTHVKMRA